MQWFDRELGDNEHIAGPCFSMADVVTLTSVDFAAFVGLAVPAFGARAALPLETARHGRLRLQLTASTV